MGLNEDEVLGFLTDEEDSDIPQTQINEESLYIHNKNVLMKYIGERVSSYQLEFLYDNIRNDDKQFWFKFYLGICEYYHLHCLKTLMTSEQDLNANDIKQFFRYIKIDIVDKLEQDSSVGVFSDVILKCDNSMIKRISIEQASNIYKFYNVLCEEAQQSYKEI